MFLKRPTKVHLSSPYRLSFELQGLPKGTNQLMRGDWRVRSGHNRTWKVKAMREIVPFRPEKPLKKATITYTRLSSMEPDLDNLVTSFKPIQDALVEAGILENDKPSNIIANYKHEKAKKGLGSVFIEIEEFIPTAE